MNAERSAHHFRRAALTKRWRQAFAVLARAERIPRLERVAVIATPRMQNRRGLQDTGGCFPAVKAAIDGLRDAGVIEDDGPDVVETLVFCAPVIGEGDGLTLTIEELA